MSRWVMVGVVGACAVGDRAHASLYDEYALAEVFDLPAGGGVVDVLPDGRLALLSGAELYVESATRSRTFVWQGTLAQANIPPFGAAFLRASPQGRLAVGNNMLGPGAEVGVFELPSKTGPIAVHWVPAQHSEAVWINEQFLALTVGADDTRVDVLEVPDPPEPAITTTIIQHIGGAPAGIALDALGNLLTGNGFQFQGPSDTGWIKAFTVEEWSSALAGGTPVDFEIGGQLVADLLSAGTLALDAQGNLLVGGGDLFGGSGDYDYAAVVHVDVVQQAMAGGPPADPDDPRQVRRLDPETGDAENYYAVTFNHTTGELLLRQDAMVYVYRGTNPFATAVVEYVQGSGVGQDFVTGAPLNDPLTALGPPTVDSTGDNFSIPADQVVPVVPVYSPFRSFEVVGLGAGGHLTLRFNHPVEDHPCNPYGVDFIVFGNAFMLGGGSWQNGDPALTVVGPALFGEPATVSVSQDGATWVSFEAGPYGDDFAPTTGRVFDPQNPDPSLGEWNQWWGAPADPTLPLDPALQAGDLSGLSLADAVALYGGSAGGTGFDIADLALPWIQYVRIENGGLGVPEVDAVADVMPLPGLPNSPPDLNGDGLVGAADLAQLLGSWGPCGCCAADFNMDGLVGPVDLAFLLGSWG